MFLRPLLRKFFLACLLACLVYVCQSASAQEARNDDAPAPLDAMIRLQIGQDRLRVPNGYLGARMNQGEARRGVTFNGLAFVFWYPDGRYPVGSAWITNFRPVEPGRPTARPDQFLVVVSSMRHLSAEEKQDFLSPQTLLSNALRFSGDREYKIVSSGEVVARLATNRHGSVDMYSNAANADLEFLLDCHVDKMPTPGCDGELYSHSENIAFRLSIPDGITGDIPSIASMAMRMFKSWMQNPQN